MYILQIHVDIHTDTHTKEDGSMETCSAQPAQPYLGRPRSNDTYVPTREIKEWNLPPKRISVPSLLTSSSA